MILNINAVDLLQMDEGKKEQIVAKVFRPMLGSLQLPSSRIQVEVMTVAGDFSVNTNAVGTFDFFFDIGNRALGPIAVGAQAGRSLYIGTLHTATQITVITGAATPAYSAQYMTGPNSNLIGTQFKFQETTAIVDLPVESMNAGKTLFMTGQWRTFVDLAFNYLRLRVFHNGGAGTSTVNMEYSFTGIRINFS